MKLVKALQHYPIVLYSLKRIYRKIYLYRFRKKDIHWLMDYDATLYYKNTGDELDWHNLQKYTEKMQWAKLFDNDERKTLCSDKYLVRNWVSDKIGEQYLIPLLGVWNKSKEIDFDSLPNSFVLKTNCGSGDIVIVRDKNKLSAKDVKEICIKLDYYENFDFGCTLCELHYTRIKPKIIAEKFIEYPESDLPDYKFLCFDGATKYCWVDIGRYHNHKRNIYDMNWNLQTWNQKDYGNYEKPIPRPENFDEMIRVVEVLCKGFSHVRVDLYNINGLIYFGEMTFTNGSGFEKICPDDANIMLGDMWDIDTSIPNTK